MKMLDRLLDVLPVSGSMALTLNWFAPAAQLDVGRPGPVGVGGDLDRLLAAGDRRSRRSRPARDVPRRVYEVAVSSTVDDGGRRVGHRDVGGCAKRRSWKPR